VVDLERAHVLVVIHEVVLVAVLAVLVVVPVVVVLVVQEVQAKEDEASVRIRSRQMENLVVCLHVEAVAEEVCEGGTTVLETKVLVVVPHPRIEAVPFILHVLFHHHQCVIEARLNCRVL